MSHINKDLKAIFDAIERKKKKMAKQVNKGLVFILEKQETDYVAKHIMPELIGATMRNHSKQNLLLLANNTRDFVENQIHEFNVWLSLNVYGVLKDPESSNDKRRAAIAKITAIGYMSDVLSDLLQQKDDLILDDEMVKFLNNHTNAVNSFVNSIDERHKKTGKFGVSGDNMCEIDKMREMALSMMRGVSVGEWYTAYAIVFYRIVATRMGVAVSDWLPVNDA